METPTMWTPIIFDNDVIIHEYAHFLESTLARTDSFGGPHNGTQPIDPRLAWSEGFANFFQAAVQETADYRDSHGVTGEDSSFGGFLLNINLEKYNGCLNSKQKRL